MPTDDDRVLMAWVKHHPDAVKALFNGQQISDVGAAALAQERTSFVAGVCRDFWQQLDGDGRVVRGAALISIKEFVLTSPLTVIELSRTQVGDDGVTALAGGCPKLTAIVLNGTQVSAAAKQEMKTKLPNLLILG